MAHNPPNPGDSTNPSLPIIDWGAVHIPGETQPAPTQNPVAPAVSTIDWGAVQISGQAQPTPAPTPAQNPVSPAQNPVSPAQNPVSPAQNPVSPAQNPVAPAQNPVAPATPTIDWGAVQISGQAQPTPAPTTAQNPISPVQNPVSPAQNPVSPAQNPVTSAQNPVAPAIPIIDWGAVQISGQTQPAPAPTTAQNPITPAQDPVAPAQNPVSPAQDPVAPAQNPVAPAIPTIDWGAVQVSGQTQPAPTSAMNPVTPAVPTIDWGAINIPSAGSQPSASPQFNPPPNPAQGLAPIDWSSVVVPPAAQRARNPQPFGIGSFQDGFPSFEQFVAITRMEPTLLQTLAPSMPGLQEALDSGNEEQRVAILREVYSWMLMVHADMRGDNPAGGEPDIMDPGIQERIEHQIQRDNVEQSRELAIEHTPEMFGRVEMLYIRCKVNSFPIVAFIDTGAQMSIISRKIAEQCGVMRLLDDRFAGMARGVGTAPILGRVHVAQLEIENKFLPCSFSVMDQTADLILGLDMLKRHQCIVDLEMGRLVLTSAEVGTPFLSESEIPEQERMFSQGTDVEQEQTAMDESAKDTQVEGDRNLAEAMESSDMPDETGN